MKILLITIKKIKKFLIFLIKLISYLNPYLYVYYWKNLRLPFPINKSINKIFPIIDPFIIYRKPSLKFNNKKLLIDNIYKEDTEYREDISPYQDFYDVLKNTFDLKKINSILDIGCSTGHLMNIIKTNHPHVLVKGIEYFDFHKKLAPKNIQNDLLIKDIRNPLNLDKYDIVICTEVAEHIEPNSLHDFILNIREATGVYLIMTWSNSYPDFSGPPQHVSSLKYSDYLKIMYEYRFIKNTALTNNFINDSRNKVNFNYWWRDSLVVFEA
jgi:SAM-dependent methyltransferase